VIQSLVPKHLSHATNKKGSNVYFKNRHRVNVPNVWMESRGATAAIATPAGVSHHVLRLVFNPAQGQVVSPGCPPAGGTTTKIVTVDSVMLRAFTNSANLNERKD